MTKNRSIYFATRSEWRDWLKENFDRKTEIWLVYPKKSTGKIRIQYNDAVEEALCFGWIDSTVKSLDEDHTMQRFTPRNPQSEYSQANKERLRWLASKEMIHPNLIKGVNGVINEEFIFPPDIMDLIKKEKKVWQNYEAFSESYKRIRIAYIDGARKRPDEFNKRLMNFIDKTRENKLISGYGGIDKYY
jgi:uncharacterized protein YdeI (YjbR/CyaY-like superfamily)